jgi:hypothetical protein
MSYWVELEILILGFAAFSFYTFSPTAQSSGLFVRMLMQLDNRGITNNLTRCRSQLITLIFLWLKQEMQFLQRLSVRLRENEVNEHDLEAEPYDIYNQVFPVSVLETDGVDERAWTLLVSSPKLRNLEGGRNTPNMTAVLPKSWNQLRPFVRT